MGLPSFTEDWMDMTAQKVILRTDANNLVTTAASTRLPEQKGTIHMIQMLRQEARSGQIHDLADVLTQHCLADPLTKKSVSPSLLISTVQTGVLREVDTHPLSGPQRSTRHSSLRSSTRIPMRPKTTSRALNA